MGAGAGEGGSVGVTTTTNHSSCRSEEPRWLPLNNISWKERIMSIRRFSTFNFSFSDLATWRKLCLFLALGVGCSAAAIPTLKESKIYTAAPKLPSVATQQTYAIYVMHGSLRYVTQDEAESLIFWREKIGPLIGIPFVAAFLILTVFRKERPETNLIHSLKPLLNHPGSKSGQIMKKMPGRTYLPGTRGTRLQRSTM